MCLQTWRKKAKPPAPAPASAPQIPAGLTERDAFVLQDLRAWPYRQGWARPLDLGGSTRSHHSATLAKLVRLGYAESTQRRSWGSRGSKVYRAAPAPAAEAGREGP